MERAGALLRSISTGWDVEEAHSPTTSERLARRHSIARQLRRTQSLSYDVYSWRLTSRLFKLGERPAFELIPLALTALETLVMICASISIDHPPLDVSTLTTALGAMTSFLLAFP